MSRDQQWKDLFWTGFYADAWESKTNLNPEDEVDQVITLLGIVPGSHILDWCGGMGRHSILFAKRGYQVTLLDYTPHHIQLARQVAEQAGVGINFIQSDFRQTPPEIQANYAVNLFTSGLGYLEEADDVEALCSLYRALKSGAQILIDTMNLFYIVKEYRPKDWYEYGESRLVLESRHFDFSTNRNVSRIVQREAGKEDVDVTLDHRVYSPAELAKVIEQAGFSVTGLYGSFAGDDFTFGSRRIVMTATK